MELASMLAGERFSDRPRSVCPIVAALVRAYNDVIRNARRQDLYRYAADCVGTRGDHLAQRERANHALAWARARSEADSKRWLWPRRRRRAPDPEDGPDAIAAYVIGSIRLRTASTHTQLLALVDELISIGQRPSAQVVRWEALNDAARAGSSQVPVIRTALAPATG
jgi:hypothetical protein